MGCNSLQDPPQTPEARLPDRVDPTLLTGGLASKASVERFYALRDHSLFWSDGSRLSASADSLIHFIHEARFIGLDPESYHISELARLKSDTLFIDRLTQMDVLLTDAWLTLYAHMAKGRLDAKAYQPIDYSVIVNEEAVRELAGIDVGSVNRRLRDREPNFDQYRALKDALRRLIAEGMTDTLQQQAVTIALNLERWRWQKPLPDRYASVNIPGFMLRVFEKDSVWLQTKVIVGKRDTPTPIMESVIRSFIIYPYWHVPKSISTKEILPALQRDATYLRRNNFDVLDRNGKVILADTIQWDFYSADNFPFILRQREGTENSMGIIKFNFSNNYGVYLHDTNSKRLYERSARDLSHGCVRVNNAVAFAHYLVREDDIYVSPEDLDQYLSLQQRLKIDLRNPLPLKLEYFTAEVRDGFPVFYNDIYKKDSVMARSIYPRTDEIRPALAGSLQ